MESSSSTCGSTRTFSGTLCIAVSSQAIQLMVSKITQKKTLCAKKLKNSNSWGNKLSKISVKIIVNLVRFDNIKLNSRNSDIGLKNNIRKWIIKVSSDS